MMLDACKDGGDAPGNASATWLWHTGNRGVFMCGVICGADAGCACQLVSVTVYDGDVVSLLCMRNK